MSEVVLVHGLFLRSWSVSLLRKRLRAKGFSVRCFNYSTVRQDPLQSADVLADFCRQGNTPEQHLVGHSLGGLLILEMLKRARDNPPPAGRVVMMGSPIAGSVVARRVAEVSAGRALLRESVPSLVDGVRHIPADRDCGMIAGARARGAGRVTGALDGPNDGTVAVEETRSEDLSDHLLLPVTHTGLLLSREVARQVAYFSLNGRFDRPEQDKSKAL